MLLYHRPVPARIPKRRSRAGKLRSSKLILQFDSPYRHLANLIYIRRQAASIEKKKKCNEERPQCDRCAERGLRCQYDPVKPRKRRRTTSAIDQEQHRSRSVTSDPGPQCRPQKGAGADTDAGKPKTSLAGFRTVLPDFRQDSASSSNLEDLWDNVGAQSAFGSPATSVGETMLDSVDTLHPVEEFDESIPVSAPGLPIACSMPDYHIQISTGGHLPSPEMSQSPHLTGMLSSSGRTASPYHDLAIMTPSVGGSPGSFSSPTLTAFNKRQNRQVLVDHFCDALVQLLVFKEDPVNPFRQLILPMSRRSSPVMNAIFAVSAAHMERQGIENEEKSLDFHSRTLQGLTKLIENPETNRDEALAVIMLLVYYEAFRYFDVMCALSFGTSPMSGNIPVASNRELLPVQGGSTMSIVDNVFGLVTELWPIIHRMAHLTELKTEMERAEQNHLEKASMLRADFEASSSTLELALSQWTPEMPSSIVSNEMPADDSKLQSIVNHAEAYKQAALVYLFRTVHGYPRDAEKVQSHVKQALQACLRVIVFAGPMSALLWPLFIAASEALEEVDRDVATTVLTHLENRQGTQNVAHAREVTREIWRRLNEGIDCTWRNVCQEMDRSVVFG
ncbi:MAG: hypothetical protein M1837_005354 [Sclerophora amabilis]|nr:MAG: hypothetical protein M1837_005354 [Sclerophora amabilis]